MSDTRLVVVITTLHGNITTPDVTIGSHSVTTYPPSGVTDFALDDVQRIRAANAFEVAAYEAELDKSTDHR